MSKVIRCDRCGKIMDYPWTIIKIPSYGFLTGYQSFDVCKECSKELKDFVDFSEPILKENDEKEIIYD